MGRRKVINQPIFKQEDLYNLNSAEYGFGEIVVSHESGHEGLYVLNNMGNKFIKVATNLSTASSAVTQEDLDQLQIEINSLAHNVTNNYYTKEQTEEKISEIISGYSEFFIDENAVRAIVNGEIDKLVDSADTEYNTLGKISNWIKSHSGDSINYEEVQNLIDISINNLVDSADTEYNTLGKISNWIKSHSGESIDYEEVQNLIDTSINNLVDTDITELENAVSGLTERVETLENNSGTPITITGHYAMTRQEYNSLIANGYVVIDEQRIEYSDSGFYYIYIEDEEDDTPTVPDGYGDVVDGVLTIGEDVTENTIIIEREIVYIDNEDEHTLVIDLSNVHTDDTPGDDGGESETVIDNDGTLTNDNITIDENNDSNTLVFNGVEMYDDNTIII